MNGLNKAAAFFAAVALGGSLFAASTDDRLSEVERKLDQVYITTPNGTCGANTAIGRPVLNSCDACCGSGWFVELSAIYWHAKVGGSDYAYTDQDPAGDFPVKGRMKDMDFHWDWGVKAGLGYNFEHDGWDLYLHYTFLDTNGDDKTFAGLNDTVIPLRGAATLTPPLDDGTTTAFLFCTHAKSQYDFDFHSLDLELGRSFFVSKNLSLRPHMGLKAAWIDLEQLTRYHGGNPVAASGRTTIGFNIFGLDGNTVHVKDKSNFRGLGPRTGLNTEWYLGRGFSLFGETSLAMVFGLFDAEHKERYSLDVENRRIRLEVNRHGFTPTVQFQLGIAYKTYFNDDRNHLMLRLGYDSQYWWRVNQTVYVNDIPVSVLGSGVRYARYSEDASLMGITFDARVDF
ncbi:MAG: hypothetical protein Tsb0015_17310 [Simkaniaceae bacterium]